MMVLLVSWQLMECGVVWVVSSCLAVEDGILLILVSVYCDWVRWRVGSATSISV